MEQPGPLGAILLAHLLRLPLITGLNIDKLGVLFQVHRSTLARRLQAARAAALRETEPVLRERIGLDAGQVRSLALVLRSQLDVSRSGLLAQGAQRSPKDPDGSEGTE